MAGGDPCAVCGHPIAGRDPRRVTCGHPRCQRTYRERKGGTPETDRARIARLMGWPLEKAASRDAMMNPDAIDWFVRFAQESTDYDWRGSSAPTSA